MKPHRITRFIAVLLILGLALSAGCGLLGQGAADEGDGALDEIDLSGEDNGAGGEDDGETGEDGEMDEIDLSTGCPSEAVDFQLRLDYQVNIDSDNGYIHERSDPSAFVTLTIQGSDVTFTDQGKTIPVTIEGTVGDCTVSGDAQISFDISGSCETGVATLDITGTYDQYTRRTQCPGQPSMDYSEPQVPGPGITADFNISTAGDTIDANQAFGEFELVYSWTLVPMIGVVPLNE
jgi:hypothetical protein